MNPSNIKIILIDDHDLVRSGIEHLLGSAPDIDVIAIGSSGEEAVTLAAELNPHIILMDLNMPGIGGIEAIKLILRHNPNAKVIALSVYDDGPIPHQSIQYGAKGYINKGCPVEEMIEAIVTVNNGGKFLSSAVLTNLNFNSQTNEENKFERLSSRELQVVTKILDGHKIPDIATALSISSKTVNTHRYRIHEKLGVETDIELVRLAIDQGLL